MNTKEYCLIGHPLAQSISPEIHAKLFEMAGFAGHYTLREIDPDHFDESIESFRGLAGFNVTIPYKPRILPFLDEVDPRAARYGAVNTVTCENGRMTGTNTDAAGFLRALDRAGIRLAGRVLVCGAGGTSRMMACEAIEHGCRLTVAARTVSKARNFADTLRSLYPDAEIEVSTLRYLSGSFDLILNGTPCGMVPDVNACPVPLNVARSTQAVFDAIYNPGETLLMRRAKLAGATVQGGLAMLVWQAAAAQELWTGAKFDPGAVDALCAEMAGLILEKAAGR